MLAFSFLDLILMMVKGIGFFGLDMAKLIPYQVKTESWIVATAKNAILRLK